MYVVFRIVLNMSEQSLEFNWMGPLLYTAHRQHTEGIFLDELAVGEDEQGSCYCAKPCIH